jgi:N-acetylneuraminic acid mutarotase
MHWQRITNAGSIAPPEPRHSATTWYADGALWLFSGERSVDHETPIHDMWRFDLSARTWARLRCDAPVGRIWAASWVENATLYMYGGSIRNKVIDELWQFDTVTCTWIAGSSAVDPEVTTPGIRSGPVAWHDGQKRAWLFGGTGPSSSWPTMRADLWSYSSETNAWSAETNADSVAMPLPRAAASSCVTDLSVWMFGGVGRSERGIAFRDLWSFDKHTGKLTKWWDAADPNSAHYPSSRHGQVLFADYAGAVYLFGGMQIEPRRMFLNDLWKFERSTRTWIELSTGPAPNPRSSCCAWNDERGQLWLFGGYGELPNGDPGILGDLWLFVP